MVCHSSSGRQFQFGGRGRQLEVGRRGLATVVAEHVPARVGSRLSDIRDVIQVRLHRGEVVEVLEVKHTGPASETGADSWYRIAPPSGEFRWISARVVDHQVQRDGLGGMRWPRRLRRSHAVRNRTAGWPARQPR